MSPSLTIYVDQLSQPARALMLLCRATGAPHNEKVISLAKGEHLGKPFTEINPFKKIPVVQDGETLLLESCTGLRYIASKYDASGHWYPTELEARSKVDEYLDWQHLNTRAHGVGYFQNKVLFKMVFNRDEPDAAAVERHSRELARVEDQFASYFLGGRPFVGGQRATIADLLAACEFEQPAAGGHTLSQPVQEYLGRVREAVGKEEYDALHSGVRQLAKRLTA